MDLANAAGPTASGFVFPRALFTTGKCFGSTRVSSEEVSAAERFRVNGIDLNGVGADADGGGADADDAGTMVFAATVALESLQDISKLSLVELFV